MCDGTGYATPAVPMGALPGNATAIVDSLDTTAPDGGTPTEGALQGLSQFCSDFQQNNPDKRCVGVLITDGQPADCNTGTAALGAIASGVYASDDVMTFTVGMSGADFDVLNQIASAGGADCDPAGPDTACNASTSPTALLEALNLIRNQVTTLVEIETEVQTLTETEAVPLECEWGVPDPPDGEELDPSKINVRFTPPDDGEAITLGNVDGEDDCEGAALGWYYDDPEAPTRIFACPDACDEIQSQPGGGVEVLVGCKTMMAVPL
jgi:hypothetical protein